MPRDPRLTGLKDVRPSNVAPMIAARKKAQLEHLRTLDLDPIPSHDPTEDFLSRTLRKATSIGGPVDPMKRQPFPDDPDNEFLRRWSAKGLNEQVDTLVGTPETMFDIQGVAPVAGAIKGLYSRVTRAAEKLPNKFHPNKALNALKQLANPEEVAYRKVPEFLKGDTPILKDDLLKHLDRNREPDVDVITKRHQDGPDDDPYNSVLRDQTKYHDRVQEHGGENYRETLLQLKRPPKVESNTDLSDADFQDWYRNRFGEDIPADQHIFDIPTEIMNQYVRDRDLKRGPDVHVPMFKSGHWAEPDVVANVLHNERYLPGTPDPVKLQRAQDDVNYLETQVRGFPYDENGENLRVARQVLENLRNPRGPKIHSIKEIQSDWNQLGEDVGYRDPQKEQEAYDAFKTAVNDLDRFQSDYAERMAGAPTWSSFEEWADKELNDEIRAKIAAGDRGVTDWAYGAFGAAQEQARARIGMLEDFPRISIPDDIAKRLDETNTTTPEGMEAWQLSQQYHKLKQQADRARDAYDAAQRAVPDNPFKDRSDWTDLALKQQLLEIADRPDIEGIGLPTGKTVNERYNLAHHISHFRITQAGPDMFHLTATSIDGKPLYFPDLTQKQLAAHIGKPLTKAMLAMPPGPAGVRMAKDLPGGFNPENMEAIGGLGMKKYYDEVVPARYNKLIKPHGGEPVDLAPTVYGEPKTFDPYSDFTDRFVESGTSEPNRRGIFTVPPGRGRPRQQLATLVDYRDIHEDSELVREQLAEQFNSGKVTPPNRDVQEWVARLPEHVKESIRKNGFGLLAALWALEQNRPDTTPPQ